MDVISVEEAAQLLGITPRRVRALVSGQRLAASRLGRRAWVLARSDVLLFAGQTRPIDRRLARHHNLTQKTGVEVMEVIKGKAADVAGFRDGDILVRIDGSAVESVDDVHRHLGASSIGRKLEARLVRGAELVEVSVVPTE